MSQTPDARIEEIRGVLAAQGRPMQAREIVAHCELVDGPTTCAQLLHRMARDGEVAIEENGHKRALYRLAGTPRRPSREPKDLRPRSVRVREWVAQQTEAFTARACAEALDEKPAPVKQLLLYMAQKGELVKETVPGYAKRVQFRHPDTCTDWGQRQEATPPAGADDADSGQQPAGAPAGDPAQPQEVEVPEAVKRWFLGEKTEDDPAAPGVEQMLLTDEGRILIVGRNGEQVEILPAELRRLLILCDAAGHLLEDTHHVSTAR